MLFSLKVEVWKNVVVSNVEEVDTKLDEEVQTAARSEETILARKKIEKKKNSQPSRREARNLTIVDYMVSLGKVRDEENVVRKMKRKFEKDVERKLAKQPRSSRKMQDRGKICTHARTDMQ